MQTLMALYHFNRDTTHAVQRAFEVLRDSRDPSTHLRTSWWRNAETRTVWRKKWGRERKQRQFVVHEI